MTDEFTIKDSGERREFESGMVRDTSEGKARYNRVLEGPMFDRWAEHLRKGAAKYPDLADGSANWTLASGEAELRRFQESALTHMVQWLRGDRSEDHAAAIFFNVNGAEYVRARMAEPVPEVPTEAVSLQAVSDEEMDGPAVEDLGVDECVHCAVETNRRVEFYNDSMSAYAALQERYGF